MKLVSLYSTIKMMHSPINISVQVCLEFLSYVLILYSSLYSGWVPLQRWKLCGSFSTL